MIYYLTNEWRVIIMKISKQDNETLETATLNFFPEDGRWSSSCFECSNDLNKKYLPCHLRDNFWLALMLRKEQKLYAINFIKIYSFVLNSPLFQEKRYEYEQEIVKFQISWILHGGEGWIVTEEYGGNIALQTSVCDLAFRKGVVDTLLAIGMNKDAIEEGIEKNAYMWRDMLMNKAFELEYEPLLVTFKGEHRNYEESLIDNQIEYEKEKIKLEPVDLEFKKKWLTMRKYEYYQNHKNSVDMYWNVEPDMQLTHEEVTAIKIYLAQKDKERKEQIERYKQNKNISISRRILRK